MQNNCRLCDELLTPDTGRYDYEDSRGWIWDICGVCHEDLKEESVVGIYEVKYRADNMFEAVVKVKAANASDAKKIALKSPDVIKLQSFGRVKFASVRLVEGAA